MEIIFIRKEKKNSETRKKKTAARKATSSGRNANYDQSDQSEGSLGGRKNPPLPASVTFAVIGCLGGIGAATRFEDTTRQTGAPAERKDSKKKCPKMKPNNYELSTNGTNKLTNDSFEKWNEFE